MKKKIFFNLLLIITWHINSYAQYIHYKTIPSEGQPPEYMRKSAIQKNNDYVIKTNPYRPRNERIHEIEFYKSNNYWINDLLFSGKVIYGESIAKYLEKIVQHISTANGIEEKIYLHPVKAGFPNAFATDAGLLFVNIGLLSKVRNEAELAFILSHEIAHYIKQDNLDGHLYEYNLENLKESSEEVSYSKVLSKHSYSRNIESEADSLGFILFSKSGYDLQSAVTAFDILSDNQMTDSSFILNSLIDFEAECREIPKNKKDSIGKLLVPDSVAINLLSTHPDTRIRKQRILNYIKKIDNNGKKFIISESEFHAMRNKSNLEMCRLNILENDFFEALFYGIYNYKNQPDHEEYAMSTILRSMIGLFITKNEDSKKTNDDAKIKYFKQKNESDFFNVALYFTANENNTLIHSILYLSEKFLKKYPESDELSSIHNNFLTYIQKNELNDSVDIDYYSKKSLIDISTLENSKSIYIDPYYITLDFRRKYQLDYEKTEKEVKEIRDNFNNINNSNLKYIDYSLTDKSAITDNKLNEIYLVNTRISEIFYHQDIETTPVDFYQIKDFCSKNQTEKVKVVYAVNSKVSREIEPTTGLLLALVSPVAIFIYTIPVYFTYAKYGSFNLRSGTISELNEIEQKGKIYDKEILNKIYFE